MDKAFWITGFIWGLAIVMAGLFTGVLYYVWFRKGMYDETVKVIIASLKNSPQEWTAHRSEWGSKVAVTVSHISGLTIHTKRGEFSFAVWDGRFMQGEEISLWKQRQITKALPELPDEFPVVFESTLEQMDPAVVVDMLSKKKE